VQGEKVADDAGAGNQFVDNHFVAGNDGRLH
jgi:hypothetical protein